MSSMLLYVRDSIRNPDGLRPKGPYKRPKKVPKPNDNKKAKQMLMGMAFGLHIMSKTWHQIHFLIKEHVQAQILFMIMAPFLVIPLAILAIPMVCLAIPAMCMAGLSHHVKHMNAYQTVVAHEQLRTLDRKFGSKLRSSRSFNMSRRNVLRSSSLSSATTASVSEGSPPAPRRFQRLATSDLWGSSTPAPGTRTVVTNARPKATTTSGRKPPTRSRTFSFGVSTKSMTAATGDSAGKSCTRQTPKRSFSRV